MKVLIVEDDQFKQDAISNVVNDSIKECQTSFSKSVQSAVKVITDEVFDVVILDMSLPSHDLELASGLGIPRLSGGVEVLFELQYQAKSPRIVIVTQYPEIELANRMLPLDEAGDFIFAEYGICIEKCVFFDFEDNEWKSTLVAGIVG